MRKSIIAIAALTITLSGVLYSCKKDNTVTPAAADQQTSVKRGGMNHMEHMGTTYNNWEEKLDDCGSKDGTCVKGVIVIAGPKYHAMLEVLGSGNAAATGTYFTDATNHQYIPAVILNDAKLMGFLSSGEAHSKLYKTLPNKNVYLIGQSTDLTVSNSLVMPVTIQD
jgi:hypothetical protein